MEKKGLHLWRMFLWFIRNRIRNNLEAIKKLYSFDGEVQDGFEEDPSNNMGGLEGYQEIQERAIQNFIFRRKNS